MQIFFFWPALLQLYQFFWSLVQGGEGGDNEGAGNQGSGCQLLSIAQLTSTRQIRLLQIIASNGINIDFDDN